MPESARGPSAVTGWKGGYSHELATPKIETALVWLRRDLRVDDNPALVAAIRSAKNVIPVYVFAPEEEGQFQPGKCSRWWLKCSLASLSRDLGVLGSRLILRRSAETAPALLALARETGASAVFYNHLYDPISLVRDNEVKAELVASNVTCFSFNGDLFYEPWLIVDEKGAPYTTFAEVWDRVVKMPHPPQHPLLPPPGMPPVPHDVESIDLDALGLMTEEEEMSSEHLKFKWSPGTAGGMSIFVEFMDKRLKTFDRDRAKTDRNSTSQLSPHIHYGEVSVRRIFYMVKQREWEWASAGVGGTSCADFLRQMGYREYSRYLSFHFPFTHERSLLEHLRACPWNFDQSLFKAWRQGATGYPLVDAGMLELWSTGWIHNRLRVICASFLVKNLLLPWQWGLKHFWDALLDADVESDALGFQYVSGCLLDAHPFSFMHDLKVEAKRFDPDGIYVRKWLPALARMPSKYIHCPHEAPPNLLADAGVELGINYPFPVISMEESTNRLTYACEVIARCCPDPPKYRKEPYYPPSDPRLAPDPRFSAAQHELIRRSSASPEGECYGGSDRESGDCCDESEVVVSNSQGGAADTSAAASSLAYSGSSKRRRYETQAEDDEAGSTGGAEGARRMRRVDTAATRTATGSNAGTGTNTGTNTGTCEPGRSSALGGSPTQQEQSALR